MQTISLYHFYQARLGITLGFFSICLSSKFNVLNAQLQGANSDNKKGKVSPVKKVLLVPLSTDQAFCLPSSKMNFVDVYFKCISNDFVFM